ncbi:MAG: FAD-dependent oxidoreductase [Myxococcales bacterium]|nr:FAD-dependent oxidoreductase [Myxococcales bacterium]
MRVIIIGAGPVGLEAALLATAAGHDVVVIDSGTAVGAAILHGWPHVKFFTPWAQNTTAAGLAALDAVGAPRPPASAYPTGEEYVSAYLEPIAEYLDERAELRLAADVVAVGRGRLLKTEAIGDGRRVGVPFRVFVDDDEGEEVLEADAVLDCSGVLDMPGFLGPGGIPAIGEATLDARVTRRIPDALGADRGALANRRILVVGAGMSAATTLDGLLALQKAEPRTRILWALLPTGEPFERFPNDPLPERDRLAALGNTLAAGDKRVQTYAGHAVSALELAGDALLVTLEGPDGREVEVECDELIANVGYRPNNALFEELQVHQCYASQAPMKLAASLLAAGGGDCLAQPAAGLATLENPEPAFFVLGAKSYGRNSSFLLRVGFEQAAEVVGSLPVG